MLSSAQESTADFLARAASHGVTHISGTPSHWRRALMSPAAHLITPEYVRLSGEIADQAILNHLRAVYPQARIAHAFASTEAGVAFDVNDGLAGFPASVIEHTPDVEMKVENGSLRIRSNRTARCYLGDQHQALRDEEGFVDTGDMLELRDDRYHFVGRRDGMINVGGMKVYPEEVEAVINGHPRFRCRLSDTEKESHHRSARRSRRGSKESRRKPAAATFVSISCGFAAKLFHRIRFRPRSTSFPPWRSPKQGNSSASMRNVIVTGGSRGIGLGIARRLTEAGFRVIAIARKESSELTAAMQETADRSTSSPLIWLRSKVLPTW